MRLSSQSPPALVNRTTSNDAPNGERVIAIVANHSCADADPRYRLVADAIVRRSWRSLGKVIALPCPIAGPMKTGLRGSNARLSNAARRVREELRQEGFRHQREQRESG
jgi:hypothetical protein